MKITEEMIAEDEKRWHARDIVTELGYCGNYMRDRKDMKNIDIRFYAYIMRKAHAMLKEQEPVLSHEDADGVPRCGSCGWVESWGCNYCDNCGKPLRWE